jgi:hypothetical protein
METQKIAIFRQSSIRKILYKNEWWFSVVDVVGALTDSPAPRRYWSDLKIKLTKEGNTELYAKIVQLKLESPDKKLYVTDCANTETMFRLIQSIPSPKAENPQGFIPNKSVSVRGGRIAGEAREKLERQTGRKISTPACNLVSPRSFPLLG